MVKRLSLLIITLIFTTFAGFYVFYKTKNPPLQVVQAPVVTPTTTPISHTRVEVVSPDAKQTLVMKELKNQSSITHTFLTFAEGEIPRQIFSKTLNLPSTITVPFNTWSPGGNKYFFLKEEGEGKVSYIVLKSNGEPISSDLQTANVEDYFAQKYTHYKITDVTGWAAPTLLIVNTNNADGTLGPSFWFDVTSFAFTQLSTRFN